MRIVCLITLVCMCSSPAATRLWFNADASRSVKGEFVSRDREGVTIRLVPGEQTTLIPYSRLHHDDEAWLDKHHPLPKPRTKPVNKGATGSSVKTQATPSGPAIFDRLAFGDSRQQVMAKLKQSQLVEATLDETFFGRTGLNGVYRTRDQVAGLHSSLFFGWDGDGLLNEVTLQSDALPRAQVTSGIAACRHAYIELLTKLYGRPHRANPTLDVDPIPNEGIHFTHVWRTPFKGSVLLGVTHLDGKYQVTVRFSSDPI